MPAIAGGHHISLTVRDADHSAKWYGDLLGMQVLLRGDEDAVHFRVLEFRTGLDHFAFAVSSRAELEDWEQRLRELGVKFTPIAETPIGSVIVFRDPDNIQLEFWLPAGQ